jgi:ankyrin repeat protein
MPKVNAIEKQATRQRCAKSPQKKTTDAGARVIHRTVQAAAIDLARMQRWSDLIERITCFRREARQIDSDGLMPLHWACSGGPTEEVIEALLKAYPHAAKRTDSGGSTALHFACHYGANAPVVQALLKSYPPAISKKDKYGRTPLYHAISKSSSVDVIRVLIEANPSMILEPCLSTQGTNTNKRRQDDRPPNHRTPLYIAWSAISSSPRARRRRRHGKSWEKAHLLLEAAYVQVSTAMQRKFLKKKLEYRVLHATVQLDSYLPSNALHIALEQHSEQLLQFDEINGRCPLALAAISSSPRAPEIMKLFVQANSQAARAVDASGQTALALALSSGKQWNDEGVEAVFNAAPDMLTRRDRKSCLYPALIAASPGSIKESPENVPQVHKGATSSDGGHQRNPPNTTSNADKSLDWYNQFESKNARNVSPSARTEADSGAEEITMTTIYELIRAEPSVVKWQ